MKKILLIFCIFLSTFSLNAQTDSSHLRISIITCGPGEELYSVFGHTAIRIVDSINHSDIVYNYGTFDFEDPNFNWKFARGKLNYYLSAYSMPDFMQEYVYEHRSVWEQTLNLTAAEKTVIQKALQTNLLPANKNYKYEFMYDNCTSRVRDILEKNVGFKVEKKLVNEGTTFRNQIHNYLDKGNMPWSKLGIDILLGSKTDKVMNIDETMFLPDYLLKGIDSSSNKKFLQSKQLILKANEPQPNNSKHLPLIYFSIVCALLIFLSFLKNAAAIKTTKIIDSFLLYITGFLGLLILFMWFATDHKECSNNYNLLWALPTNIIPVFAFWKKKNWAKKYFKCTSFIYGLLVITWFVLPQQLNIALLPLVFLLLLMSFRLSKQ